MGYRLEISKIEYVACGGKLMGYVEDDSKLRSHQWLLEKGYIEDDESYWDYGYNPRIILRSDEFKEFIKLYIEDKIEFQNYPHFKDEAKKLLELAETQDMKLIEWL